jgi:hypothetical protein
MQPFARVIAALWMGSLWTVCGLVAPTLFAVLDDRRLAGDLAGEFFTLATWLGLGLAVLLFLALVRIGNATRSLQVWIAVTALAPAASEAILRPFMSAARSAGNMTAFGALHAVSAALFLVACVGALLVVLQLNRRAG